jgi:galactose mutarotase-like enzyme
MINIKNKYLKVKIDEVGAELKSVIKKDYEYMWQGDPQIWKGQAPNLFPLIGRLKDEEYIYNGSSYHMGIHGFAKFSLFEVIEQGDTYVTLRLSGNEKTYPSYAFDFELLISYELQDMSIVKKYAVTNNSYKPMYFEAGGHDGYNLTFSPEHKMDEYYLEFSDESIYTYTTDEKIMVNKSTKEIPVGNRKLNLHPDVFKNDALILDCSKMKERSVSLKAPDSSRGVKVTFDDFGYLGIWTKPIYSNYVCIEPWSSLPDCNFIDKNLENKIGIIKLDPNRSEMLSYTVEIL